MKRKSIFGLILMTALLSGLGLIAISNNTSQPNSSILQTPDSTLSSNALGDLIYNFSSEISPLDLAYLNGVVWVADGNEFLIGYNAVNGAEVANLTLPFNGWGVTADGTNLYVGKNEAANGTIVKLQPDGTILSYITVTLASGYFDGLAWDGSYLWGSNYLTSNVHRINPTTGAITRTLSVAGHPFDGIAWQDGLLWGVDFGQDDVVGIDPVTGEVQEVFTSAEHFDQGLASNGTHFFESKYSTPYGIYVTDYPTEVGEVYSIYSNLNPLPPNDIAWNGTHYWATEGVGPYVMCFTDGNFYGAGNFHAGFEPLAIAATGNQLYVSQEESPYNVCIFNNDGMVILNRTVVAGVKFEGLAYDGAYLWAMGNDSNLYKLDPTTLSVISGFVVGLYRGIAYDSINGVIWAVHSIDNKIKQIDPSTGTLTGVEVPTGTNITRRGLTFDGQHLVMTSFGTGDLYKIIIDFPTGGNGGGIPGFADLCLYLTLLLLIGVYFLKKQRKGIL